MVESRRLLIETMLEEAIVVADDAGTPPAPPSGWASAVWDVGGYGGATPPETPPETAA